MTTTDTKVPAPKTKIPMPKYRKHDVHIVESASEYHFTRQVSTLLDTGWSVAGFTNTVQQDSHGVERSYYTALMVREF